jgi:glyoxylate reductase
VKAKPDMVSHERSAKASFRTVPSVFVAGRIDPPAPQMLNEYCHVEYYNRRIPPSRQKFKKAFRQNDAVVIFPNNEIDKDMIKAAERLKVISSYTVGFNHIDVEEATRRGIYVTCVPAIVTDATADLTWAILLAAARRIPEADGYVRQGKWRWWSTELLVGAPVYGKTLGIIGAGRIGIGVVKRAKGFGMNTQYYDVVRSPLENELKLDFVSFNEVLSTSDFISIHVSLSEKTFHLIGEKELALMKPTAYLVNASRGPVVDEKALIEALKARRIAGAALDVFEKEPIETKNELRKLKNVVLTPHIGSATQETRYEESKQVADNLLTLLRGEMTTGLVNSQVQQVRPLNDIKMIM